jgi:uncharacterized membrane protein
MNEATKSSSILTKPIHPLTVEPKRSETHQAITIRKSPEEVYAFWRNFENLATFMKDISRITVITPEESEWEVELKSGAKAKWKAVVTDDRPGSMITWQSIEGSQVETSGGVWFVKAPGDQGTVVELMMDYHIPGGKPAELITMLSGEDPKTLVLTNLKRLKALLETGEIPTTKGQPSGREELKKPETLH